MTRTLPLIVLLSACGLNQDPWFPGCDETITALGVDEASGLGFAASDVLDPLATPLVTAATHADGASADLTITVTPNVDGIVLVERVESEPPPGTRVIPSIAVICEDAVRMPITLGLTTADGLFDETVAAVLEATSMDAARWSAGIGPTLDGTFEPDPSDLTDFDSWAYRTSGTFFGATSRGTIDIEGQGSSGEGPDAVSFASRIELLTWTEAAE